MVDESAAKQIDKILLKTSDRRDGRLSQLRRLIKKAEPDVGEEVKWKEPSRPEGVPVWSRDGIPRIGEMLKHAVRRTFPKGAPIQHPKKLFNARLVVVPR